MVTEMVTLFIYMFDEDFLYGECKLNCVKLQ